MGAGYSLVSGWSRAALTVALACLLAAAAGAGTARAADPGTHDVLRPAGKERALARAEARREFRARTGRFALLAVDPATATPRAIGRLDGFLTGRSNAAGRDVALGYVRARPELFGLDAGDLAALELVRHYTAGGIEQLTWAQTYEGVPAMDTSLTANLTEDGRLINVLGGPRPDLVRPLGGAGRRRLDRVRERRAGARGRGAPGRPGARPGRSGRPSSRTATPPRSSSTRAASPRASAGGSSSTSTTCTSTTPWSTRPPARSSATRTSSPTRPGLVFKNHPGATVGGSQEAVNLDPYLDTPATATRLFGPTAHTFSDTGDTVRDQPLHRPDGGEQRRGRADRRQLELPAQHVRQRARSRRPCTWDPFTPTSWTTNRRPDAVTLHWLIGNFHDHLENTPQIAFDNAAGNFEGVDRVVAQNIDGANTDGGFPDEDHFNNANMTTYPEGTSPHMQMYLTVDFFDFDEGRSTALDASVVYHEYTHGLVGRTITDAGGFQAVGGAQSGAINEGTADWYAMDYLVGAGLEPDSGTPDVMGGKYSFGELRSEPMDCLGQRRGGAVRRRRAARAPAATRTATSARSSAARRCTRTARSGRRRCGSSARR